MKAKIFKKGIRRRLFSGVFALAMVGGLIPGMTQEVKAATPESGYVGADDGTISYKKVSGSSNTYDIHGYVNGAWSGTTYTNQGFKAGVYNGGPNLKITSEPVLLTDGQVLMINYTVENTGDSPVEDYRFYIAADTMVAGNDNSNNTILPELETVLMTNPRNDISFFALSTTDGVGVGVNGSDCNAVITGTKDPSTVTAQESTTDSYFVMYFPKVTIGAGEKEEYNFITGVGNDLDKIKELVKVQREHAFTDFTVSGAKISTSCNKVHMPVCKKSYSLVLSAKGKNYDGTAATAKVDNGEVWKKATGITPPRDVDIVYYTDEACTKKTTVGTAGDGKTSGAATEGGAPVNKGKYWAMTTVDVGKDGNKDERTLKAAFCIHAYDNNCVPVIDWADDYSKATLSFTCDFCQKPYVIEDKDIKVVDTSTCLKSGERTYTAEFHFDYNNKNYKYERKEDIPATGHDFTDGIHEAVAAKCTEAGMKAYYSCKTEGCGKLFATDEVGTLPNPFSTDYVEMKDLIIPATGHAATFVPALAPTCTTEGNIAHYKCSIESCGKYFRDKDCMVEWDAEAVKRAALGHNCGDTWVAAKEPTCTENGNIKYGYCNNCGSICKEEKEEEKTVIVLVGSDESIIIPALGHDYTSDKEKTEVKADANRKQAATCTEDAIYYKKCSRCDTYSETDTFVDVNSKTGHDFAAGHHAKKLATCTEDGSEEYWHCATCDKNYSSDGAYAGADAILEDTAIKKLGHNFTGKTETDAYKVVGSERTCAKGVVYYNSCVNKDCTQHGASTFESTSETNGKLYHHYEPSFLWNASHTECKVTYECVKCHDKITDTVKKDDSGYEEKPATSCLDPGTVYIAHFTHDFENVIDSEKHQEYTAKDTDKNAPAKHYFKTYVYDENATCTGYGTNTAKCENCDVTNTVPDTEHEPIGHAFGGTPTTTWADDASECTFTFACANDATHTDSVNTAGGVAITSEVIKEPTCLANGTTRYTAKVTYNDKEYKATKDVQDVVRTGHVLSHVTKVDPTCDKAGNIEYWYCEKCDHYYAETGKFVEYTVEDINKDGKNTKADTVIAALGHDMDKTYTVDKAATCTEAGERSIHCNREGCTYKTHVEEIKATGHKWNDGTVTTDPTCTEKGVKTFACTVEGCTGSKTEDVAALGHDMDKTYTVDKAATCTEVGSKSVHCKRCTYKDHEEEIPATGHKWNDGTATTEPTCTEKGVKTYACTVEGCTGSKTEDVAALGHDMNKTYTVDKAATCTEAGSKSIHCARCTYTSHEEEILATGHKWNDGIVTKKPTCTAKGEKSYACTVEGCTGSKKEDIAALGHDWEDHYTEDKAATCEEKGNKLVHCSRCTETRMPEDIAAKGHVKGEPKKVTLADGTVVTTVNCSVCGKELEKETVKPVTPEVAALDMNRGLKVSQSGSKINVSWGEVPGATGYKVYVQYCGKKYSKYIKVSASNTNAVVKKINGKKINLKKNYKVKVVAYKEVNGKMIEIGETIDAHIVGVKNSKFTNVKSITLSKSSFSLKKGATSKIKAKTILVDKNKKALSDKHAKEFRYATSNKAVATVSKSGKIKAVGAGTCNVYVYARNGYAKKVTVTVK